MSIESRGMESKEGIDALFLYATEGILVTDGKGVITRVNPSVEKLFGYRQEELTGQKIEILVPKRLSAKHVGYREKYASNPHARSMGAGMDLYGLKKDGSEFPIELSLSPYNNEEGLFVIAFIIDITLRKEAEQKLKNYSEDLENQVRNRTLILEEAVEELEKTKKELHDALETEKELNELKSRFVSMASHEFRTPLTTMMSSLSLVTKYGEQNDTENQSRHVQKIKTSIGNMTDILNDLLSVSRLEEGKVENAAKELNIRLFVEEITSDMQGMLTEKQSIVPSHSGSELVLLDPKLLKNILFNLLSNAIKFSPEGGRIEVETNVTETTIIIRVKDNGIGISKQDQKHLFERFFRGRNASNIQGTGLGLTIISRYLELMNGSIRIDSKENEGTQVTILLTQQL